MSKYHINTRGEVGPCSASSGNCPFGENVHFGSEKAGQNAIDRVMLKLENSNFSKLTDRQYDVAKSIGIYNENMVRNIGERNDYNEALKAINESDNVRDTYRFMANGDAEFKRKLSTHQKAPFRYVNPKDTRRIDELSKSNDFTNDEFRFANASANSNKDIAEQHIYGKAIENAIKNRINNGVQDTELEYAFRTNSELVKGYAIEGMLNSDDVNYDLIEKTLSSKSNYSLSRTLGPKGADYLYERDGTYSLENKNLTPETLDKIIEKEDVHNSFNEIYEHPNASNNNRYNIQQKHPDIYQARYNYANTGKSPEAIRSEITLSKPTQENIDGRSTLTKYTYQLDPNAVKRMKLTEQDLGGLFGYGAKTYNEETGEFTQTIDSSD